MLELRDRTGGIRVKIMNINPDRMCFSSVKAGSTKRLNYYRSFALSWLVAQWIEGRPANQGVTGLILSQGTCLGCGLGPWLGECERQLINVSLPLFLSLPENKLKNKIFLKQMPCFSEYDERRGKKLRMYKK